MEAVNQELNADPSHVRTVIDCWKPRFASVRCVDAWARSSRDSVFHFAAANPDHAATRVTIESSPASARDQRSWWVAACRLTWPPASLAISTVDRPSLTQARLSRPAAGAGVPLPPRERDRARKHRSGPTGRE